MQIHNKRNKKDKDKAHNSNQTSEASRFGLGELNEEKDTENFGF